MAEAHRIKSEQEALEAARRIAEQIRPDSRARDKERRLPFGEIEWFSQSGLWGITVPKEYGGAGVSTAIFAEVVAIVSEADASIGKIRQNHYANIEEIRLVGTEAQKAFFFDRILKGDRLGNAAVERSGKTVLENQTKLVPDGDGYRLTGEKFYSTGALFAHWVPVRVTDSDGNRVVAIVSRRSEGLTVIDDWSSFGQRTTASGTVILKDVRLTKTRFCLPVRPIESRPPAAHFPKSFTWPSTLESRERQSTRRFRLSRLDRDLGLMRTWSALATTLLPSIRSGSCTISYMLLKH